MHFYIKLFLGIILFIGIGGGCLIRYFEHQVTICEQTFHTQCESLNKGIFCVIDNQAQEVQYISGSCFKVK